MWPQILGFGMLGIGVGFNDIKIHQYFRNNSTR